MLKQQQGFSFFGLIFLIAIIGGIISIAIKIVPAYLDFLSVSEVTRNMINQPRMGLQRNDEIMRRIANQLSINNIRLSELGKDAIKLSRTDGMLTADIDYIVEKPVFQSDEMDININIHFATSHEANLEE